MLVKHALEYFNDYNTDSKLQSQSQAKLQTKLQTKLPDFDMINEYYNRIKIALQVKHNLLSDISDEKYRT